MKRPGRFDCLVEIESTTTREDVLEIFKVATKNKPLSGDIIQSVAHKIPLGATGAEITNFCREAALIALHNGSTCIGEECFDKVLFVFNK